MARFTAVIYCPDDPTFQFEDFVDRLAAEQSTGRIEAVLFDSEHRPAYEFTRQQ